MASQNLRQRSYKDEPTTSKPPTATTVRLRRDKKMAMAKRGVRSLAIAIMVPLVLHVTTMYLFRASTGEAKPRTFWHPPVWAFHLASLSSCCLMGLSAWLVWAEGGFRANPAALALYLGQLLLSLLWPPVVFGAGATRTGLVVCVALLAVLFGCSRAFRQLNPIAADLVKPCLAWVSFLAVFNYKMLP